jgi:hypothetical protein
MGSSINLRLGLALFLAAAVPTMGVGHAQDTSVAKPQFDRAALAQWGVSGRIVSGKIPTLNITIEPDKILAAWPQIRAAGVVGEPGDTKWLQAHSVTICKDVALAAMPTILHDLYREDDALDYAPVYVFLGAEDSDSKPELMFSINVNRTIVRKLSAPPPGASVMPSLVAQAAYSPWLEAHLRQEQP